MKAAVTAPVPVSAATYDDTTFANAALPDLLHTSDTPTTQVRFNKSPEVNFISPHSYSSRQETSSLPRECESGWHGKHKRKDEEAEERLASATRNGFEPPFQALVYQVSLSDPFMFANGGRC